MVKNPEPSKGSDAQQAGRDDERSRPKKSRQQRSPAVGGPPVGPEPGPEGRRKPNQLHAPARKANGLLEAHAEEGMAQLEQALQRERDFIARVLSTAGALVIVVDHQGRIVRFNQACERLTGYTFDEVKGQTFWDLFLLPEERKAFKDVFAGLLRGRFPNEHEKYWVAKNGARHLIQWSNTALTDSAGDVEYVIGVGVDITQRREAEAVLRESEERFRTIFEGSTNGILIADPKSGRFLMGNGAICKMLGYEPGEITGMQVADIHRQEDMPFVMEHFEKLANGAEDTGEDIPVKRKDGSVFFADVTATPIMLSGKAYLVGSFKDITERKRVEAALRESEHRFRRIFENAATGIAITDWQGRFQQCNPAYCALLGYTEQELRRLAFPVLVHPEDRDANLAEIRRLQAGELPFFQIENRYVRKDGRPVWVHKFVSVLPDATGRPTYLMALVTDVSEQKRAEQRLRRENREIALANRVFQLFVEETGDDLFDKALHVVLEGLESRHGVFGYIDENGDLVCPSMSKLLTECEVANKCICYPRDKWKGLWSRALLEKRTLYTNEPPAVPKGHVLIRNNLAAPILFQGQVIGLLNLANRDTGYGAADCELIEAIAARVAPVLYAWVQRRWRENEREAAGQALAASEQRLRLALEGGRMGRWEWDLQTDSVFCCERTRELLGWRTDSSATSERFFRRVHPDDKEALEKLRTRSATEPADFQMDFRVIHAHGEPRGEILWLASRGRVIHDEKGRAARVVAVLYDITPRKQMEEQLQRLNDHLENEVAARMEELWDTIDRLQDEVARRVLAEGKLRKRSRMLEGFFQHTITPLAFMDKYFNFVRVNEAYARADDKTPEFFVGKNHFALYPHEENQAIFQQVVRTKRPYYAYAKPFVYVDHPERGVTYWNWQLTPQLNEFGDVQSLVLSLENVTERQKAFQEIEQRARQLQKLTLELSQAEDRERRRLAEILHDDLQQQLAAAKFHLGILRARVKDNGPVYEMTSQLNVLLRDVIEKSRSLSHELSPTVLYQGDLGETFEWLARQVQAKHGLTVHVEIRGQIDPKSEAIRAFLFKAAREILFNVVKHARTREAKLRLQQVREQLWLTITDKGRGFDPELLGSIGGFGLLSIRERAELLGGRMRIKSARGKGSAFLIAVRDDAMMEARTLDTTGPQPAGLKLRVLLVDDHKVVREGLAVLLGEQGDIEVVGQAGNGREAVDLAHQLQPDVIVMDAAMPIMPGDEATRQIKQHLPTTRVIALSMSAGAETAERMREAGAEAYLLKTAPSEELLAAIRGAAREQGL